MEEKEYIRNAKQMIELVRCAMSGEKPDAALTEQINTEALFQVCESHVLTAAVAYALESAGIQDKAFSEAKNKAIRKNILHDAERKKITAALEAAGIWYMPLKGALLKDWYPKLGMRQMSDNDILYDGEHREKVRDIMESLGFTIDHFGDSNCVDAYVKLPVCNFEMHRTLFKRNEELHYHEYFSRRRAEMLRQDEGSTYGRHFSPEDFYLYFLAHEYKHFHHGGTGVRSLLDTYVIIRKYGKTFDRAYLKRELEVLKLTAFEKENRTLAVHLFSGKPLTQEEETRLRYYITSGTYGIHSHSVENKIQESASGSKAKYIFRRIFPPMSWVKEFYPFFYRHPYLMPVLWVIRPVRGLIRNRTKLATEARYLRNKK